MILPDRTSQSNGPGGEVVDQREALCNEGLVGLASEIQRPTESITRLNGLMLDLDPTLLAPGNPVFPPADDPREFLAGVAPVLDRHPVLRDAEVRSSGRGLHAVVKFDPPVELRSLADQKRWSNLVRAVQGSLPADPNAPGITALTRPVGSINSKNGARVEVLRPGRPVEPARVEAFVRALAAAPFRVVAMVLLGSERVEPCPVCRGPGSSLGVNDRNGTCYRCSKVTLEQLYEVTYQADRRDGGEPGVGVEADSGRRDAAPGGYDTSERDKPRRPKSAARRRPTS